MKWDPPFDLDADELVIADVDNSDDSEDDDFKDVKSRSTLSMAYFANFRTEKAIERPGFFRGSYVCNSLLLSKSSFPLSTSYFFYSM